MSRIGDRRQTGQRNCISIGEDEGGEQGLNVSATLEARWPGDGLNGALHIGSDGNGDDFSGDDRKINLRIDSVSGFCGAGPDGCGDGERNSCAAGECLLRRC